MKYIFLSHSIKQLQFWPFKYLLVFLFIFSCNTANEVKDISVGNRYSLTIPAFMSPTKSLNEKATLQYQHTWKELYVIVLDEPRQDLQSNNAENLIYDLAPDDFDLFAKSMFDHTRDNLNNPVMQPLSDTVINDMRAIITSIRGSIDGINVVIHMGMYEG